MDICRRLSQEVASLGLASSAAEHRRHLQSILDLLEANGAVAVIDQTSPVLWGDLAVALLRVAHRQLSRAFPSSKGSAFTREERLSSARYNLGPVRERSRKTKPVALSPNDAIVIQNIFKHITDTPPAPTGPGLLLPPYRSEEVFRDIDNEEQLREKPTSRGFQDLYTLRASERGQSSGRGYGVDGEDDSDPEACRDRTPALCIPKKTPLSDDTFAQPFRLGKRITDVVRSLFSLLVRCAMIRGIALREGHVQRESVGPRLLSSRACGSSTSRVKLVVAQQRAEVLRKYSLRKKRGVGAYERAGRQRKVDGDEDGEALGRGGAEGERGGREWRGQIDEKWEGCFLTILQQILNQEDYVEALPYDLIRGRGFKRKAGREARSTGGH